MDVKTTFLDDLIEEEVYINQRSRHPVHGALGLIKKFTNTTTDPNLYYLFDKINMLVLVLCRCSDTYKQFKESHCIV